MYQILSKLPEFYRRYRRKYVGLFLSGHTVYSSWDWELLERFARIEVKDQGQSKIKCTFVAESCSLIVWRRDLFLMLPMRRNEVDISMLGEDNIIKH